MRYPGPDFGYSPQCPRRGEFVQLLHRELTLLGYVIPECERQQAVYWTGTWEAVKRFKREHGLHEDGVIDEVTAKAINGEVDSLISYTVTGTVWSPDRADVSGLHVKIVDKNVGEGGDVVLAESDTDVHGHYKVCFDSTSMRQRQKAAP